MLDMTWGIIAAAAKPCSARNATREPASGASPQAADMAVKPIRPSTNSRLRPNASPSREPVTSATAKASGYAAIIHWSCDALAPRSASIVGSATFTMLTSISSMVEASSRLIRAACRGGAGHGRGRGRLCSSCECHVSDASDPSGHFLTGI